MKNLIVLLFILGANAVMHAQVDHQSFDALLGKYVSSAGVDYAGLKSSAASLETYCEQLAAHPPSATDRSASAKAYWMNAYNAFTLKLILDNHPVGSIMDLHGGNPWDVAWITLGSDSYTLNQIEKEILIKGFGDARVHFGINCAARSCPSLSSKAFTATNVESELERLTKTFLMDKNFNTISSGGSKVSKIFEWYAADFGDVGSFIKKYTGTSPGSLSYAEYDWSLNSK
ncbi:MAG: DUF547 domain-containing protein [Saprospiraceae bacterium]|nr:DUF547 domain-containing protein [Saprospiraceae bacterium]